MFLFFPLIEFEKVYYIETKRRISAAKKVSYFLTFS